MKSFLVSLVLLFFANNINGQNQQKIDSLKAEFENNKKHDTLRVDAITQIIYEFIYKDRDSLFYYSDKLFHYSEINNSDLGFAEAHYTIAGFYGFDAKRDSAIFHYNKAIYFAQRIKSVEFEASCHLRLSGVYLALLNIEKAKYHNNVAITLLKEFNNYTHLGDAYVNLGMIHSGNEEFDLALKNLQIADSIFVKYNLRDMGLGNALYNLAHIHYKIKDYDKSKYYFNRTKELYIEIEQTFGVEVVNLKLGEIALEQKKYKEALPNLIRVVTFFKNTENKDFIGRSSNVLGQAYLETNNINLAIEIIKEAEKTHSSLKDSLGILKSKLLLGKAFFNNKNYSKSIDYGKDALLISKRLVNLVGQEKAYFLLAKNYKELRNFKVSNDYLLLHSQIKDSLNTLRNIENLQKLETQYQTKKKEQEISLLQSEKELALQQKENQRNLLLAGIGFTTLVGIFFFFQYRSRKKVNKKLKELDVVKTSFFENISHEFRTPLTLILGPIQKQLKKENLKDEERNNLEMMQRNSKRILSLVDQLLDISKIESGKLKLMVSKNNLFLFLNTLIEGFSFSAKQKKITLVNSINLVEDYVWFDKDVIEKIITNLLSNAIKYTSNNGEIECIAMIKNEQLCFQIKNSGGGISDEDISKIFERFYKTNEQNQKGTGIGLSLVKILVVLHKGTITVESIKNEWTIFNVVIPINKSIYSENEIIKNDKRENLKKQVDIIKKNNKIENNQGSEKPILLIVEDNIEVRNYISSIFKSKYSIIQAENGQEGIDIALKHIPDFIISDIMMPIKNGIELCNHIKTNELTSHIPIVLLTAKSDKESEIEGVKTGADDYITKPFNEDLLLLKVKKILETRNKLRERFLNESFFKPKNIAINSTEEEFFNRVKKVLDSKLIESSFTIEEFSKSIGMSRMQLHRKLKALTGLSTSGFIRLNRIKLAAQLLKNSNENISQIGYSIGFSNPGYFIKSFKEVYHITPSEYSKKYQ